MCNIAAYAGNRAAAPILLEMLRRQQDFDGGVCTGITTIYEGRLYSRKIVGDVDALIKHTDALYLPGTVGIAHTRPGGNPETYAFAHTFVTQDETIAGFTNGTAPLSEYHVSVQNATDMLEAAGYKFRGEAFAPMETKFPVLKNGSHISCVETRTNLVHYYYNQGMSMTEAMSKMACQCYTDSVFGAVNVATPDRFYILRTTRPAQTLKTDDGIYVASTRFAFPDGIRGEVGQLPVMYPCEITKDTINIVKEHKMTDCEEVSELTEYTLEEGYRRICDKLRGKGNEPLHFDDLELAVGSEMRDLFPGDHTLIQHARLVYDVLWRLREEGKLKTERRWFKNEKFRTFMWI
ncbi:MAG: hypothetical protein E7612_07875 [Ruminococcaceae bacterium]|nr:hypothetical protein [Oscillospiraceae bacterium]